MIRDTSVAEELQAKLERLLDENLVPAAAQRAGRELEQCRAAGLAGADPERVERRPLTSICPGDGLTR
jgi:hypothetical protein